MYSFFWYLRRVISSKRNIIIFHEKETVQHITSLFIRAYNVLHTRIKLNTETNLQMAVLLGAIAIAYIIVSIVESFPALVALRSIVLELLAYDMRSVRDERISESRMHCPKAVGMLQNYETMMSNTRKNV